jgi:hypothetical protein
MGCDASTLPILFFSLPASTLIILLGGFIRVDVGFDPLPIQFARLRTSKWTAGLSAIRRKVRKEKTTLRRFDTQLNNRFVGLYLVAFGYSLRFYYNIVNKHAKNEKEKPLPTLRRIVS